MRTLLLVACLAVAASCVTVRTLEIEPIDPAGTEPIVVDSPVKVHLVDGSTVVFRKGIRVVAGEVIGEGLRYDPLLRQDGSVTRLPLADVAAMESFQTPVHTGATAAASTATTAGGVLGGTALLKAIFGSCPTTYSFADGAPLLEAESFSYSIAPGFETLDVDRLGLRGDATHFALELRNEALETHYIDRYSLLFVEHGAGEAAYADHEHRPFLVGSLQAPAAARDSDGAALLAVLAAADGIATRASDARLAGIDAANLEDALELEFAVEPGREYALVLRARNSLLNTVLLYDVMLAGQGFRALDWMGRDLRGLLRRYRLARWYWDNMGLRVSVMQRGRYREVAAFEDTGPIAWKDLALRLPPATDGRLVVRLASVADNWRIDRAAIAPVLGPAGFSALPPTAIVDRFGARHETAREYLASDDGRYLVTGPGDYLRLQFDSAPPPAGRERTWFLAATGYYIEWMRRDWLATSAREAFRPGDDAIVAAVRRWRDSREAMRAAFDATRIPTR